MSIMPGTHRLKAGRSAGRHRPEQAWGGVGTGAAGQGCPVPLCPRRPSFGGCWWPSLLHRWQARVGGDQGTHARQAHFFPKYPCDRVSTGADCGTSAPRSVEAELGASLGRKMGSGPRGQERRMGGGPHGQEGRMGSRPPREEERTGSRPSGEDGEQDPVVRKGGWRADPLGRRGGREDREEALWGGGEDEE